MYKYPDIDKRLISIGEEAEAALMPVYRRIDEISEENQYKVLSAFREARISEGDFFAATGYGYNETGRDKLEKLYSLIFHTEDALVRPQITCGTHALYLALNANLLPGDEILFASGKPYDSLESSIGIRESALSLKERGVSYRIVGLKEDGSLDRRKIIENISDKTKLVYIQRSKGYELRPSVSPEAIGLLVRDVKERSPGIITMTDNCYGEFTRTTEPSDHGCDLIAGSLIKNPGGSLAPMGGYIAGREDLVERCAFALTAPGLGKEVGPSLGTLRAMYQGLSLAPVVVAQALKNAHFAAYIFEHFGYKCEPASDKEHNCIVETIELRNPEMLEIFCSSIQASSYVDSFVRPEESDMPGYEDRVIMASGSFISGSSIELSADGPMREPYAAFFQGGVTCEQGRYAILKAINNMKLI